MNIPVYSKALVCPPAESFASGLTTVSLGIPDLDLANEQHLEYCAALKDAGLELLHLPRDSGYPDSTFVEDTAIVRNDWAILTRPGATSRLGEVERVAHVLTSHFETCESITAPGTVDGGDICEIGNHYLIGLSHRTNEEGCRQLSSILVSHGMTPEVIDIRGMTDILHLKSGIAYLGEGQAVVIASLREKIRVPGLQINVVPAGDEYAANCIRVNEQLFMAAGFPRTAELVRSLSFETVELNMSEFQKMDGGLSCLSLRY